jgi:hypothetical protein
MLGRVCEARSGGSRPDLRRRWRQRMRATFFAPSCRRGQVGAEYRPDGTAGTVCVGRTARLCINAATLGRSRGTANGWRPRGDLLLATDRLVVRPRRDCVCRTGLGDCCDELPEGSGVHDEGHREVTPDDFGLWRFAALFRERSTVVPNVLPLSRERRVSPPTRLTRARRSSAAAAC